MAAEPLRGELAWRCRRGMKELDLLLLGWLDRHFEHAGDSERALFVQLLALPDPQLARFLLGTERPQHDGLAALVTALVHTADHASPGPVRQAYYVRP